MPSIRAGCGLRMDAHLFVDTGKVDIEFNPRRDAWIYDHPDKL